MLHVGTCCKFLASQVLLKVSTETKITVHKIGTVGRMVHNFLSVVLQPFTRLVDSRKAAVFVKNEATLVQYHMSYETKSLPYLKVAKVTLSSYSITMVKEIHKKQTFVVPEHSCRDPSYSWYCFEFLWWAK